jgi:hypothetical protein
MTAILSPCLRYRYRLERQVRLFGQTAAVIMVNPSTADATANDPTIRRLIGFAERLVWSRIIVGNVFAYRAADVGALNGADDPFGPENAGHLRSILADAQIALFAWGTLTKLPPSLRGAWRLPWDIAAASEIPVHCLGTAKDGHPRHPLMVRSDADLVRWSPPE